MKRNITILFMLLLGSASWSAQAQTTYTWTGAQSSSWTATGNWSPNGTPGPADRVVIPGGRPTTDLLVSTTIRDLRVESGATLRLMGNSTIGHVTLNMSDGDLVNAGAILLTNNAGSWAATLDVAGKLRNTGTVHATGTGTGIRRIVGTVENEGTIRVDRPMTISGDNPVHENSGKIEIADELALTVTGGTLVHTGGRLVSEMGRLILTDLTLRLDEDLELSELVRLELANVTVDGPGSFTIPEGMTVVPRMSTFNADLDNRGLLTADRNFAIASASFHNRGTGRIVLIGNSSSGHTTLTVARGFTNEGVIELTTSSGSWIGTLNVAGTLKNEGLLHATGTGTGVHSFIGVLENAGEVRVDRPMRISGDNPVHKNSGKIDIADELALTVAGGTLVQSGGRLVGTNGRLVMENAVLKIEEDLELSELVRLELANVTVDGPGSFTIPEGTTVVPRMSTFNADLDNRGLLTADRNFAIASASFHNRATGRIVLIGNSSSGHTTLTVAPGFTNEGVIELTTSSGGWAGQLTVTTGTFVNEGTLSSTGTGTGIQVVHAEVDNRGTIAAERALRFEKGGAIHRNSGEMLVTGGSVSVAQTGETAAFIQSGSIRIAAPHSFAMSGGTVYFQGTDIRGEEPDFLGRAASMTFTNTTLNLSEAFTLINLDLALTGTVVHGPGELIGTAGRHIALSQATINADVVNRGALVVNRDSRLDSETFANAASGVVRVSGNGSFGHSTLTFARGFLNEGTVELTNAAGGWTGNLTISNGSLINEGAIVASGSGTGTHQLVATIDNRGAIRAHHNLSITPGNVAHRSSGTVELTGGNVTFSLGEQGSFYNDGMIVIGPERSFTVNGGAFTNSSLGTIGGQGRFDRTSNQLTNHGGIAPGMRPAFGENLLVNGDAERGPVGTASDNVAIAGWTDTGAMSILPYDYESAEQAYLKSTDAGPDDRGSRYFWGGVAESSSISRVIDVRHITSLVDLGTITFTLSGYLGGFSVQNDQVKLEAAFIDEGGETIDAVTIGPVTAADRNFETGLLYREADGRLPVGTKSITVTLTATRFAGTSNDGYADNLSFVLRQQDVEGEGRTTGILSFAGDLGFTPDSARAEVAIGGTTPGTSYDRVAIGGTARLGGALTVTFINGFVPGPGEEFEVMTFAAREGEFATVNMIGLPPTMALAPIYEAERLVLRAMGEGEFLAAPRLMLPEDGAEDVPSSLRLVWEPSAAALSYEIHVALTPHFTTTVIDTSGVTEPELELSGLSDGTTYHWRVRAVGGEVASVFSQAYAFTTGRATSTEAQAPVPTELALLPNYPNPFNPSTTIAFTLPEVAPVSIRLYDMLGRQVAVIVDSVHEPGRYNVPYRASGLASGVYLMRMESGGFSAVRSIVLMR